MPDTLGDDINWKLNDLGWYLPRNTVDELAAFLRDRKPLASPALAAAARDELDKRASDPGEPEDEEPTYPPHLQELFAEWGLDPLKDVHVVEYKGKSISAPTVAAFFDVIDRCLLHLQPSPYLDAARDASAAMRSRMGTMLIERMQRRQSDAALKQELRNLATVMQAQIQQAKQREALLQMALVNAQRSIDAAMAIVEGKPPGPFAV